MPLHVQLHNSTQTLQLMSSEVQYTRLFSITHVSVRVHSVMSLDWTFQIHATATKHSVTSSQHYETHPAAPLFGIICVYRQRGLDTSNPRYWLQVWRDSDTEQVYAATVTDTLFKLKGKLNICCMNGSMCESSLKHVDCYSTLLTVLLARRFSNCHDIRCV